MFIVNKLSKKKEFIMSTNNVMPSGYFDSYEFLMSQGLSQKKSQSDVKTRSMAQLVIDGFSYTACILARTITSAVSGAGIGGSGLRNQPKATAITPVNKQATAQAPLRIPLPFCKEASWAALSSETWR